MVIDNSNLELRKGRALDYFLSIVETVCEPLVILDSDLRVTKASRSSTSLLATRPRANFLLVFSFWYKECFLKEVCSRRALHRTKSGSNAPGAVQTCRPFRPTFVFALYNLRTFDKLQKK
jgi:hypothetical protein